MAQWIAVEEKKRALSLWRLFIQRFVLRCPSHLQLLGTSLYSLYTSLAWQFGVSGFRTI